MEYVVYLIKWSEVRSYYSLQHAFCELKKTLKLEPDTGIWMASVGPNYDILASRIDPAEFRQPIYSVHSCPVASFREHTFNVDINKYCAGYPFSYYPHIAKAYIDTMYHHYGHALSLYHESIEYCRVLKSTTELLASHDET